MRQDGSREFLTLIAYINAIGEAGKPLLIYQGASNSLIDTWMDDLESSDKAYFTTSENGWSDNTISLQWLIKVFDPNTRGQACNRRRLLIMDGHSSHLNMAFITKCDALRIVLLIFPPHTTHRLQPLDLSCFRPLSIAYSQGIQKLMHESEGIVSMTKKDFWRVFRVAWEKAMSKDNILSGFSKAGIWPPTPSKVLDILEEKSLTPPNQSPEFDKNTLKTPLNPHTHREIMKATKIEVTKEAFKKVIKANEILMSKLSIAEHRTAGLSETLRTKEKANRRGKRLNLAGEPSGGATIWGVEEVIKAKEYQRQELERLEKEKEAKLKKKEENQRNKARKQDKSLESQIQRDATKNYTLEERGLKRGKSKGSKASILEPSTIEGTSKPSQKVSKKVIKKSITFETEEESGNESSEGNNRMVFLRNTRSGRVVKPSRKYDNEE